MDKNTTFEYNTFNVNLYCPISFSKSNIQLLINAFLSVSSEC